MATGSNKVSGTAKRTAVALALLALCVGPVHAGDMRDDLKFWLENMIWHHGYSVEEAAVGLGMPVDEVQREIKRLDITQERFKKEQEQEKERAGGQMIKVMPWAPGRHPRIGFLEGAIDPQRDTKISVFLPWEGAGSVVYDLPEAVFVGKSLIYLAHTHIPTVWSEKGIKLPQIDWTRGAGGTWNTRRKLPNGVEFASQVMPTADRVVFTYLIGNGTKETLTLVRSQLCLLLRNAPDFNRQTGDNKLLMDDLDGWAAVAVHSRDGRRWIVVACSNAKGWQNPKCPCMHADPTIAQLGPQKMEIVSGALFFVECERSEIQSKIKALVSEQRQIESQIRTTGDQKPNPQK